MVDQLDQPPGAEKGDAASGEGAGRGEDAVANLRVSRAAARARAIALLALLLVPIVMWLAQRGYRRLRRSQALEAVFSTEAGKLDVRLSHPAADRPRRARTGDGGAAVAPGAASLSPSWSPPRWALAELERAGDRQALVAAAVLAGDLDRASALLDSLTGAPVADAHVHADAWSDRAAVDSLRPNGAAEALEAADRALALTPNHSRANWNRGVVLEGLGLPLAAAEAFEKVAKSGNAGWAPIATARAERLRQQWQQRVTQFAAAGRAVDSIKRGTLPPETVLRQHPDLARVAFYIAAREDQRPEVAQSLAGIAARLEQGSEKPALAALLGKPALLRELVNLRRSATVANAEAYQKLAEGTGDPWLLIRGAQFLGQARTGAGDPAGAEAAYERALAGCQANWFPQICIETKIWLAYLKNNRRRIQEAKRWAAEAKRDSQTWLLPVFEAKANARLAVAEDLRERFPLARAYATESALQTSDCPSANTGRELLAKIALGEGDNAEARRQLEAVARCGGGGARFGMIGTETLAALAADRQGGWDTGRTWLRETIAQYRAQSDASWIESMALRLFEGRVDLVDDRAKGQSTLDALVNETKARAPTDEAAAMIRIVSTSALVVDQAMHDEFGPALTRLEGAHGLREGRPCVLGAVVDGSRGVFIARTGKGEVVGERQTQLDHAHESRAVPKRMLEALSGCDEVGVIATAPLLGQPRLLPPTQAWSYLRNAGQVPAFSETPRRLVIYDARPPDDLGLARLPAVPALTQEGSVTEVLQGAAATPSAALDRAMQADLIEWHVHGLLDPEVSDAAALALSPEGNGRNLLTAADILKVTLPRKPGVILGACRAGQSARYGAYQWSLPLAFLSAGARWVIASPTPIEDVEAPAFFSGVWQRIRKGASPAAALRDERHAPRWQTSFRDWIEDIVIFQ